MPATSPTHKRCAYVIALTITLIFVKCDNVSGQPQFSAFQHITVNDGLSQSTVHAIIQDHMGFMWFGTSDGLNRFDGYTIVVYRHIDTDSTTLDNSVIRAIFEDQAGTLWIGTDKGLNRFDRTGNTFTRYTTDANNHLTTGTIEKISGRGDGRLWIEASSGLYVFDPAQDAFTRWADRDFPSDVYQNSITAFCRIRTDDKILVGSARGLKMVNPEKNDIEDLQKFPAFAVLGKASAKSKISCIFEDSRACVWVGNASGGLWRFNPSTGHLDAFSLVKSASALRQLVISSIAEDAGGRVCVATYGEGIFAFDERTNSFTQVRHDDRDPSSLSVNLISCLYLGSTGIFWIGTDGAGVDVLKPNVKPFHLFKTEPLNPNSLSGNFVRALFEDREGRVWVGTVNSGLNMFDRRTNNWTHYLHDPAGPGSIGSNTLFSIREDAHGDLWIGRDNGLDCLKKGTHSFIHYTIPPLHEPNNSDKAVRLVLPEDARTLWLGTPEGLQKFDLDRHRVVPGGFTMTTYGDIAVTAVLRGMDGTLWVGCESGGLLRCNPLNHSLDQYDTLISLPITVRSMLEDESGKLWLGTDRGLLHFNPADHSFKRYSESDGLANNFIYGMLKDTHGNLWISTNKGISRFTESNPAGKQFNNFDVADGLQGNEFNTGAFFENAAGEMYFGGVNGFNVFHPDSIRDNNHAPQVVVTSVKKFDDVVANEASLGRSNVVTVDQKDNVITFEFVALEYTNPAQNQYEFMLQNFDTHWSEAGNQRFARYTNLDPGEYLFRVRASNNDGMWNEEGASVRLIVVPPFWRTWWFAFLSISLTLALVVVSVRIVATRRLQRRLERLEAERALLNERTRISKDMHDEIGSNLTQIAILSEVVQKNLASPEQVSSSVTRISDSARAVIDNMSEIIWAIDPRNDKLDNLAAYIREFMSDYFEMANIRCHFDIPKDLSERKLSAEVRRNIFLTVKEAVNNIVKHSRASEVFVLMRISPDCFEITMSDNGQGFDPAGARAGGNGLHNMAKRIHDIGGSYSLISHPGTGTTITLSV